MVSKLASHLLVANIKATYYACKQYPSLYQSGLDWYHTAHNQALAIARRHGVDLERVCGVISALSPNNRWQRNLVDAELVFKAVASGWNAGQFKVCTFHDNKQKAIDIANGQLPLQILSGNKTRSFYLNLLRPDNPHTVTIDGHAVHIALGKFASLDKSPSLSDKQYALFASAYLQATKEINADSLEPPVIASQVQAITWMYYRVIRGIDKGFDIN